MTFDFSAWWKTELSNTISKVSVRDFSAWSDGAPELFLVPLDSSTLNASLTTGAATVSGTLKSFSFRPQYRGKDIPVFSVCPNWDAGLNQKLSYHTIICEALDLSEERFGRYPRCLFGLTYKTLPLRGQETGYIRQVLELAQEMPLALPVWTEGAKLTADIAAVVTSLPVDDTTVTLFTVLHQFAIIWRDYLTWEIVQVTAVNANSLTITATLSAWKKGDTVFPLAVGFIPRPAAQQLTDEHGVMQVEFIEKFIAEYDQSIAETSAFAWPTYRGSPVLNLIPDFLQQPTHGQIDDTSIDGVSEIRATPWKQTSGPKRTLTLPYLITDLPSIRAFRSFAAGRDGRRKGFWVPIWATDFEPSADAAQGATTITVLNVGLNQKISFGAQFRYVALITPFKMEFYRVSLAADAGATEILTLDRGLDTAMVAASTVVCGMLFARFASDDFDLQYLCGDVVRAKVSFVELPTDSDTLTPYAGTRPLYLYEINRSGTISRLAGWGVDLTVGGNVWTSSDITQGPLESSMDFLPEHLSISVTTDDPNHPFRYFLESAGSEQMNVTIYEVDADVLTLGNPIYKGRCSNPTFSEKGKIEIELSSILRIGEMTAPRIKNERNCQHHLYDQYCGLTEAAFQTTTTVSASSKDPAWIEAAAFGTVATSHSDPNWFALGKVKIGNQIRKCVGVSGIRLYLNAPFSGTVTGVSVTASAGCDKLDTTCNNKFANIKNHLGFHYVPSKNPALKALESPKPTSGKKS